MSSIANRITERLARSVEQGRHRLERVPPVMADRTASDFRSAGEALQRFLVDVAAPDLSEDVLVDLFDSIGR